MLRTLHQLVEIWYIKPNVPGSSPRHRTFHIIESFCLFQILNNSKHEENQIKKLFKTKSDFHGFGDNCVVNFKYSHHEISVSIVNHGLFYNSKTSLD